MKNKRSSFLTGLIAVALLQLAVMSSQAQIIRTNGANVIINNFDDANQVLINDNLTDNGSPRKRHGIPVGKLVWCGIFERGMGCQRRRSAR